MSAVRSVFVNSKLIRGQVVTRWVVGGVAYGGHRGQRAGVAYDGQRGQRAGVTYGGQRGQRAGVTYGGQRARGQG